jgi:hypothetical protein
MSALDGIQARAKAYAEHGTPGLHAPQDRARLLAAVHAVEALAEKWRYKGEFGWGAWQEGHGPDEEGTVLDHASGELRAAIAAALEPSGE